MSPKTFEITSLPENLIELLADLQNQTEILLTSEGVPFAKVLPLPSQQPMIPKVGLNYGAMVMSNDFDEPLPDDFWGL
ncbi:toxin-antitoxin (TA) system antitoxin [Laspinema palackyanum]|uniref:toxin-antitoxin (TA) system antitoxin n=1 Tax=Laspinema palackyanum TaxID=3231601 RepID=UPI00345DB6F9|nr:toxin-antitoxin (TA) system antitoxin [Laspinema sp. D2c]